METVSDNLMIFCIVQLFVLKTPPGKDKAELLIPNQTLPSTLKGWTEYICPEHARHIFRTSRDLCCINTYSITNQARSPN